jgi:uncharacterized repeat protein (TIGR04076 family)
VVKCKITVIKRSINEDFARKYTKEKVELCPRNIEGQEYISIDGEEPENFCSFAKKGSFLFNNFFKSFNIQLFSNNDYS